MDDIPRADNALKDALPIVLLCMPALLAVSQETLRDNDVSALNFTVLGPHPTAALWF